MRTSESEVDISIIIQTAPVPIVTADYFCLSCRYNGCAEILGTSHPIRDDEGSHIEYLYAGCRVPCSEEIK